MADISIWQKTGHFYFALTMFATLHERPLRPWLQGTCAAICPEWALSTPLKLNAVTT
jgi:hypothetical protein